MPGKIDYYDGPNAPKPNSMVPAVSVVVVNGADEVLVIRRSDNDNWALPGGKVHRGESVAQPPSARPGKGPGLTAKSPA